MPLSETVIALSALLAVAMAVAVLGRRLPLPYTVVLVLLGLVLGELGSVWAVLAPLHELRLSPDVVFFLFLPALIYESGLSLDARMLLKDIAPVLMLAVIALLAASGFIGLGLHFLLGMEPMVALLFGALISATDPVAVIAIFKELGAPARLTVLVEGESLLNDATAVVLFGILIALMIDGSSPDAGVIGGAVLDFLRVFLGGIAVGAVIAVLAAEFLVRARANTSAVLVMSLATAYASFAVSEHVLHLSGVMAAATGAITFSALGVARMPQTTATALGEVWELIALTCNSLLFLLVGLSIDVVQLWEHWIPVALSVGLVLAARAATVWTLVPLSTQLFRLPRITRGEQCVMWWGGLKGGLAIAMVLSVPESMPWREFLITLTLGVVLFTLVVNAQTIRPLMRWLGLARLSADEAAELERALNDARAESAEAMERIGRAGDVSRAARHWATESLKRRLEAVAPVVDAAYRTRDASASARQLELATLGWLRDVDAIPQLSYLDMRNAVQREADAARSGLTEPLSAAQGTSILDRLESFALRWLREQDWAARLLGAYQNFRLARHLRVQLGWLFAAETVLEMLRKRDDLEGSQLDAVSKVFEARASSHRRELEQVRREYPDFYASFESRLAERIAVAVAMMHVEHRRQHAEIGAKVHTRIATVLESMKEALPPVSAAIPRPSAMELLQLVPLLSGLPESALRSLSEQAQPVTALTDDVVIGEGDKGDALYIVIHGELVATRSRDHDTAETLGYLNDGDFFGEMALLGEHVRTASVCALMPSRLLRLTRNDVLALARHHPELASRLADERDARLGEAGGPSGIQ